VHGTKLGGVVNTLENRPAIQKDLSRLEKWVGGNLMWKRLNRPTQRALVMEKAHHILDYICKMNKCGSVSCLVSQIQDRC